jgi:hypothetical protein
MGQKPKVPVDETEGGGQLAGPPLTHYDLESEGQKLDAKHHPDRIDLEKLGREQGLRVSDVKDLLVIKNEHQIRLIIVSVALACVALLVLSIGLGFLLSSSADRIELLKGLQPYFTAVLALVAGGAGGAAVQRLRK